MEPNVCCGVGVGGSSPIGCELYVGHEGEHAAVVLAGSGRALRRWASPVSITDVEFTGPAASGLPWAPGHPSATKLAPSPTAPVAAVATTRGSTKARHLHIAS